MEQHERAGPIHEPFTPEFRQNNVWMEDGKMVIQFAYDTSDDVYSAGRIDTSGKLSPLYGWFEIKMQIVPVHGTQSAFWLWPENGLFDNDAGCSGTAHYGAEIDIIEAAKQADLYPCNIHYDGYSSGNGCYQNDKMEINLDGLHEGFHTFGLHWTPDKLEWYADGSVVRTIDDPAKVDRKDSYHQVSLKTLRDI